jgi:hypothetical protein
MNFVLLLPTILCLLTTAALALRETFLPGVLLCLALCFLLLRRQRWVLRLTQIVLLLACLLWLFTAYTRVQHRIDAGEPYLRLAIIEYSVAALNLLAAALFQTRRLQALYPPTQPPSAPPPPP